MTNKINLKQILPYLIGIGFLILMGFSYAYIRKTLTQENNNTGSTLTCLQTTLTEENNAINLVNQIPISNQDGMSNDPFTFTITNTCQKYEKINIALETLAASTLSPNYLKANLDKHNDLTDSSLILGTAPTATAVIVGDTSNIIKSDIILAPNASKTFDLRIWLDYNTTLEQGLNKTYQGKVIINAEPSKDITDKPIITNNTNTSTYVSTLNVSATISDTSTFPLDGIAFTTTNTTPTASSFTELNDVTSYNFTQSISKNGTYYLWARNTVGNITKQEINISNMATLKSYNLVADDLSADSVSNTTAVNNLKAIDHYTATEGTVSSVTSNGNNITLIGNALSYDASYTDTCTRTGNTRSADSDCNYSCSSGSLSGTSCYSSYGVSSTFTQHYLCTSGSWKYSSQSCSGNCNSSCNSGYSYGGSSCGSASGPSGSCSTQGASRTATYSCSATCSKTTSATCNRYYYCSSNEYRSGSTCYSCNTGETQSQTTCSYTCTKSLTKYKYNYTVYYWEAIN
jgi:hypothetical protein